MTSPSDHPGTPYPQHDSRVTEFEERLTFQQRTLDDLNEVVLRQQEELEQLRGELKDLRSEVQRAIDLSNADPLPDEKPPHY